MGESQFLTRGGDRSRYDDVAGRAPESVLPPVKHGSLDAVLLADGRHQREARLAATLPPKAALVLPFLLALARIQARRDALEHVS